MSSNKYLNELELSTFINKAVKANDKICFFCGAGISKEKPSYAPDFIELRNSLILSLLQKLEINDYLKIGDAESTFNTTISYLEESNFWLKPEIALHWFYESFGTKLFDALQCLNQGFPNISHKVLASFCLKNTNTSIITTNFDLYFEMAFEEFNSDYYVYTTASSQELNIKGFKEYLINKKSKNPIIKPHGTLELTNSIKTTLTQVSSEISKELKDVILDIITDSHVFVLGYSGNDYDLFPILKSFANQTKSLSWLFFKQKDIRHDITDFTTNTNIAIGNVSVLSRNLIPNMSVESNRKKLQKDVYQDWLHGISMDKIAYTLALLGMHIGQRALAEHMCQTIQSKSKDVEYIAKSYNILGILQRKTNPNQSLFFYNKAIEKLYDSRKKYHRLFGNLLGNIGVIYYQLGKNQDALKYYRKSNYWASRYNHKHLYYENLEDMAIIFRLEKEYKKAISYLNKTQKYFKQSGNLIELAHSLNNLALIHSELNDLDKAEKLLNESILLKEQETADFKTISGSYMALAEINILNNKYYDAVNYLNKASKYVKKNMDVIINARIYYDLAFCMLKLNHPIIADRFLQHANNLALNISYWQNEKTRMEWINKIKKEF